MATLKDLIVQGASRFIGKVIGSKFIVEGGTSSQFLKADGSVDGTTYCTNNDSRLSNSRPASDVSSWAKASTKPTYTASEVGAATSGHTHSTSIATSSKTNQITLAYGTKYALTAGGTSYVFTMPSSDNTWRPVSDSVSSTDSSTAASSKAVKTAYDLAASKTSNTGTVTSVAVKMNGSTKGTVTTSGTIDLGTVITTHQDISGKVDKTINKTWAQLKAMRDGSTLAPGLWYRITDYTCTTTQENTQSAGHVFDIIVRADETNVLNENAYAAKHSGDTYFANSNLAVWELKYTLDNIYWSVRPEEYITLIYQGSSIKAVYDGTKIISGTTYFRWHSDYSIGPSKDVYSTSKNVGAKVYYYYRDSIGNLGSNIYSYVHTDVQGKGTITWMKDEYNNECPYDFKNIQFKVGAKSEASTVANVFYYTFSVASGTNDATVTDHSLDGFYCHDNRIMRKTTDSKQELNFNIFRNSSTTSSCHSNTFWNNCNNNTFGNSCNSNIFGNACNYNTFGNSCYYNMFGNSCSSNTFGDNCHYNTFGNSCTYNTFGNIYGYNIFGNACNYNTFGDSCNNNTFGNACTYNTFGNSCNSNIFGNACTYNTFGNSCYYNMFGNYCRNITFSKDYSQNIIIENSNQFITFTSTQTTSSSSPLRNIKICQGVNNTTARKTISHDTVNDTFQTEYKPTNSKVINV